MNWRRGMLRLWVVISILWVGVSGLFFEPWEAATRLSRHGIAPSGGGLDCGDGTVKCDVEDDGMVAKFPVGTSVENMAAAMNARREPVNRRPGELSDEDVFGAPPIAYNAQTQQGVRLDHDRWIPTAILWNGNVPIEIFNGVGWKPLKAGMFDDLVPGTPEFRARAWSDLRKFMMVAVFVPVAFLILGAGTGWVMSGFRKTA